MRTSVGRVLADSAEGSQRRGLRELARRLQTATPYGSTLKVNIMPLSWCSAMWQWAIHTPKPWPSARGGRPDLPAEDLAGTVRGIEAVRFAAWVRG